MNRIAILLVVIIGIVCSANAVEPLKLDDLVGHVFESISAEGTNIVLRFKLTGSRFNYAINDSEEKLSEYGETVRVPIGTTLRLYSRGMVLSFSALPSQIKDYGFCIHMAEDHRSGGKLRREKEGYLVFQERLNGRQSFPEKGHAVGIAITKASIEAVTALTTNVSHGADSE